MKSVFFLIALLVLAPAFSQVVNGYAEVSSIAGAVVTVSNVDEGSDTFEDGEQVIIMQMQDNVIGSNTANNANFGLLGSISSAGLYEVRIIQSHTESGGLPATITLDNAPSNTFNTGSNSRVQILTYPELGTPNYTNGNLSSKAWDGTTGGVIAFQVSGILTIGGDIDADEDGFRGATANVGGSTGCTGSSNYRVANTANHAQKGEGIYRATDANYDSGRARILNGGGGGNSHNAGGGGGGNYTAGGLGGPGWPTCTPTAGGMGGIGLSGQISASRIFMGGGGGSGEGNNGGVQDAGDGGGIIIIKADEIRTTGSCGSGRTISANGGSITNGSGNDGNSGGGAGGTILIDVNTWSVAAGCPLTIEANGGDGGDVTTTATHGAGGGGGQGAVIYSITQPSTNTTTSTQNGSGGANCNTCGSAASGSGSSGSGIIDNVTGPLPITLTFFKAQVKDNLIVELSWQTETEIENDYFIIEKSQNGLDWSTVAKVKGAGNSSRVLDYKTIDTQPYPNTSYYRLKQIDFDGSYTYTKPISVQIEQADKVLVYPNPANDQLTIEGQLLSMNSLHIYNTINQSVVNRIKVISEENSKIVLDISNLNSGVYYIKTENQIHKIVKL